jgi:hypothetical protein
VLITQHALSAKSWHLLGLQAAVGIVRKKLALTWSTSGDRSVGIVRSRTEATEFVCLILFNTYLKFEFSEILTLI